MVWWLAKGLSELGHQVSLICYPGSYCPFATIIPHDFKNNLLPDLTNFDVLNFFSTPALIPGKPLVVNIGGNGKIGETFHPNTVFVSKSHALRHGAEAYVYNGVDPEDYIYLEQKKDFFVFCAKASWRVKNVKGAIRFASRENKKLKIMGGTRWISFNKNIFWLGMLGGREKAEVLAEAKGLLFPIEWNEPFGLAVVEALMSGTPVIATRRGAMPELINESVGFLCETESEFLEAIRRVSSVSSAMCRDWAMERFHYKKMAKGYLACYEKVLQGKTLNSTPPRGLQTPEAILPISRS